MLRYDKQLQILYDKRLQMFYDKWLQMLCCDKQLQIQYFMTNNSKCFMTNDSKCFVVTNVSKCFVMTNDSTCFVMTSNSKCFFMTNLTIFWIQGVRSGWSSLRSSSWFLQLSDQPPQLLWMKFFHSLVQLSCIQGVRSDQRDRFRGRHNNFCNFQSNLDNFYYWFVSLICTTFPDPL